MHLRNDIENIGCECYVEGSDEEAGDLLHGSNLKLFPMPTYCCKFLSLFRSAANLVIRAS